MDSRPLLIFNLDGARFGLDAARVRESLWLPELTPVEEAPPWLVGLFSLRGQIVPVIDMHLRFGRAARRYTPENQVVVLETDHLPMGLIVDAVIEVIELSNNAIQSPPQFGAAAPSHLVAGEARVGENLVTLLDISRLTHLPQAPDNAPSPTRSAGDERGVGGFCPQATPQQHAVFRARAKALLEAGAEEEGTRLGLAVVELGGEYFGVELAAVQEFCDIARLSPIPCCPPHILGAMNLRGELLTLIDPRAALNLSPAARGGKAVVARIGEQPVGIAVDDVHDVVYLRREELLPPPPALRERCGMEITGTAPYVGRTMTVLNLPALLAREAWIVDEN